MIHFRVEGDAAPKQSFRATGRGFYASRRVKDWQAQVGWAAKEVTRGRIVTGPVAVRIVFYRVNGRLADVDNLSKGVLDGMRGVVFVDDRQVQALSVLKALGDRRPGCEVWVWELPASVRKARTGVRKIDY